MSNPLLVLCVLAFGYLLGSIPFGYVLMKLAGRGDIRTLGSGNIGATNVLRTGNKKLAALTLLCDGIKGATAVLLVGHCWPPLAVPVGLAALLGHLFPVWLKFKGGKGVATAMGILTALAWPLGVATMLTWLVIAKLTKYSSLAALISIGLSPVGAYFFERDELVILSLIMALLIFWKHSGNIERLIKGTEPKIK